MQGSIKSGGYVAKCASRYGLLVCKMMIDNHTDKGQTVYDPFMGSGTTAVAALECDRLYVGSEIDEDVFKLCNERISQKNNTLDKFMS